MKSKSPIALLVGWIVLALAPAHEAVSADGNTSAIQVARTPVGKETITGVVTNSATGRTLEGARVVLQGTGRETLTDSEGVYRFSDVAPGSVAVSVSYTGLNTVEIPIEVAAGTVNRRDVGLTSDIYTLSKFVVSGEREGNALAITLQRNSMGVRNIASSDAFGDAQGNVADVIMRMPGVSGDSFGGATRFIRIRGMSPELNSVTMDGNRLSNAGSSDGSRASEFYPVGADALERMELVKSPTPDMDGDSIGGSVNMVSRSAFDRPPDRTIKISLGGTSHLTDSRDRIYLSNTASYSEVFGGRLGISANYSHRKFNSLYDRTTQRHQTVVPDPAYTYSLETFENHSIRPSVTGGFKVDLKLSENTRLFFNSLYTSYWEHGNSKSATYDTTNALASIVPGFTRDRTEFLPTANSKATVSSGSFNRKLETIHLTVGAVHKYDTLDVDYDAFWSSSASTYPGNYDTNFIARGLGIRIERKGEPFFPDLTQISGPPITSINSYTENLFSVTRRTGDDVYRGAAINLKKRMNAPVPSFIKAGLRIREQTRDVTNTSYRLTYVGPDGVMGVNPATGINDDNLARFVNPTVGAFIRNGRYPRVPFPAYGFRDAKGSGWDHSGYNMGTALVETPQYFRDDIAFRIQTEKQGAQTFTEKINAGYIMGSVDLGKMTVMGGVRVETTRAEGEGALTGVTPAEKARRAAWVGPVTDEELARRTLAENSGRQKAEGEYRDVFPGLHLKYEPFHGLIARASYATNVGRPNIGQLIPRTTVNYDNKTLSTSNPALLPQYANNFDAGIEYYFEPVGLLSAGVFLKEIKNFIFTQGGQTVAAGPNNGFDGDYEGFALTSQKNGGSARIKGFEIAYQQQFMFLPGWWSGFGVFANYTRLSTEGDYGGTAVKMSGEVAGFTPESGNLGISYVRNKWDLRVQFNHVGQYLQTYNANQALLLYKTARSIVDIKTGYAFNKKLSFYLNVENVFNEAGWARLYFNARPEQIQKISPSFSFGVNATY